MKCPLCGEAIAWGDELHRYAISTDQGVAVAHEECMLRSVIGGVNHQLGTCTCCGGTDDPDPPGLTKRQAAQAAAAHYYRSKPWAS